jgi:hypothetical protein
MIDLCSRAPKTYLTSRSPWDLRQQGAPPIVISRNAGASSVLFVSHGEIEYNLPLAHLI